MYVLLHLALELTDLLLAQLVITRRELESNQYGSLTTNLSVENSDRTDTLDSNNSLQTENSHANDNARTLRRNADRERLPMNRDEMPSTSRIAHQDTAEDLLSVHGNKRYRVMAQRLKRLLLFRHRRGSQNNSNTSVSSTNNSTATRPNDNGDGDHFDDNIQSEDNRQSTSESALSAEVQSIVERIRSSSSIDDDRAEVRTGIDSRTIDTELQNSNENRYEPTAGRREYRRNYRNATLSEPAMRRIYESRNSQERDAESSSSRNTNWSSHAAHTSSGDEQNARTLYQTTLHQPQGRWYRYTRTNTNGPSDLRRPPYGRFELTPLIAASNRRFPHSNRESARSLHQPHQRAHWPRQYTHDSRDYPYRYGNLDSNYQDNRRFPHDNSENASSLRREFNVPELQVNSVPVNDLDNPPTSPRRRQNTPPTPPHTPPPYLITNFIHNDNRNNDGTNDWTDQPGPSGFATAQFNSNANRVCYESLKFSYSGIK